MHPDFHRRPMPSESAVFWFLIRQLLGGFGHAAGAKGHVGTFLRLF